MQRLLPRTSLRMKSTFGTIVRVAQKPQTIHWHLICFSTTTSTSNSANPIPTTIKMKSII